MPYSVKITVGRARTALLRLSLAVEAPENSAMCLARGPANSVISAGSWGRHRGCQAVESRVSCCRCPVRARAFRGRPPEAGTARHPIGPACRQVVQFAARWWSPPEHSRRNAARAASGRNRRRGQAMAARSGPEVSPGQVVPVRPPHWKPPSTHMKARMRVSYPWRENGLRSRRFRKTRTEPEHIRRDCRRRNSWSPPHPPVGRFA